MTQNTAETLSQYEPLVRKVARRFAWSRLDPEDLQQTARLGIIRGLENYDTEKGALTPYFSGVAYYELATYCRRTAFVTHQTSRARRLSQRVGIATRERAAWRVPRPASRPRKSLVSISEMSSE